MRLGYSTNAFVKFSLCEAVEKIAQLGFGGIEIMGDRPHLYPPDFGPEGFDRLRSFIQEKGLKITNLNSFTLSAVGNTYLPSWIEPQAERRQIRIDHTRQCLQVASRLECSNISTAPGGPVDGMSKKEAMTVFYRGLEKVIPEAEALGVKILVEPEPMLLIENSRQFREFIKDIHSPAVGLNFDIGHFFCVGEDPAQAFQELFPWVGHVHLDDIGPSRIHHHLIPGDGAIDLLTVFQSILKMGYKGDMSLELYTYDEIPVEAGRESLRHILPLLSEAGLILENG
ncbi:MAG: sugar phosphate isomerase/epimerase [Deltaproteobacteria bacterium]|nr:sugar phosphate isomerase/epimerase [Deltaproteobacteria bacterium]